MRKLASCPTHFTDRELFGLLLPGPSSKTSPTWLNLIGVYIPVGTALETIEPCKLLHHSKVQSKVGHPMEKDPAANQRKPGGTPSNERNKKNGHGAP